MTELGGGAIAVAVFGGCSSASSDGAASSAASADAPIETESDAPATGADASIETESDAPASSGAASADAALRWERVVLGSVSAYVLARGSEVSIVDTGGPGSEDEILLGLQALGGTWADVDHVICTHSHGDHIGSVSAVSAAAPTATVYIGSGDLASIDTAGLAPSTELVGLDGGEEVFGLLAAATPGHTAGHISVFDDATGLLIAGDSLTSTDAGQLTGPSERFTADMTIAAGSVRAMAALSPETILVGHGAPVSSGAAVQLAALAS